MSRIEAQFAEVEKRVRALVAENKALARRIQALERELEQARKDAQELHLLKGGKMRIREKLERVLKTLEALGREEAQQAGKS